MKCNEVQPLQVPYMDSELDARTSLEIDLHLKGCPECKRLFENEERCDAWLKTGLNRGGQPSFNWHEAERAVRAADESELEAAPSSPLRPLRSVTTTVATFREQLRSGWNRSRWTWTGIGAAWFVIFVLNVAEPDGNSPAQARATAPSTSELRFALKQNRLLMAELAILPEHSEPSSAAKPTSIPLGPRSDRRKSTLNT